MDGNDVMILTFSSWDTLMYPARNFLGFVQFEKFAEVIVLGINSRL